MPPVVARDYPRVCGADFGRGMAISPAQGLPPRVRGRPERRYVTVRPSGTTPACAGQTSLPELFALQNRDYPRVCGAD